MREFSPPVRPSKLRVVLAVALPLLVLIPIGGLLAILLGQSPATYTIADGALTVRTGDFFTGTRTVRLAEVSDARVAPLSGGRRVAGTALPGFCGGRFRYPDLGTVWQATTCSRVGVVIRTTSGDVPVVISPPDPEVFIERLHAGTATQVTLPAPDKGPLWVLLTVVGLGSLIAGVLVGAVLLLGPGKMRYRVGDGALEVVTLFGRQSWPTRGARAREYTPQRLLRVAGTAAPGYYTGRFRESGQAARVYATELGRVVLFEGEARVLVSPEDRATFLQALADAGVTVEA